MKKIFINIVILSSLAFTGCNDSFLDKTPVTELTEETAFNSYDNFKAFMWPCYEMFTNTTIRTSIASGSAWGANGHYLGDVDAGYLQKNDVSGYNQFANQVKGSTASGNGWDFSSFIRRINIMWSHLDNSQMTQAEKDHWRAVGNFFHSFWYMELIDRFGDVPWVDTVLDESSSEAYGPRVSRDIVAKNVMTNLKWAYEHIGDFNDGENTINKDCILFAISRFGLREGTWRKYHGLSGGDDYLKECIVANALLMKSYPILYTGTDASPATGYGEMWTTEDLKGIPGVILYKSYVENINPHGACYVEHTSSHPIEMNQFTVDLYLMDNGKPIANPSSGYQGKDKDMYHIFRNRDPRLYQTVIPPYKVEEVKGDYATWSFTDNAADKEYIELMGKNESCSNPGVGMKRLPGQNWTAKLVPEIPRLGVGAYVMCRSGYYVWKNWDNWETNFNNGNLNTADKPIFKIEEILLNEAEAQYELNGRIEQTTIEATINKLRERAGVDKMIVADIDDSFDPNRGKYYPKDNKNGVLVDPVLWEIRRERIVELMGEGFGFYDIRRWRMAPWFLDRVTLGTWVTKEAANAAGLTLYNPATGESDGVNGSLAEGNIFLFPKPKGWLEKYYLYQVPTTEIVLNDKLDQNPGW